MPGAVVSENSLASEIGANILAAGGNAVDAAIATTIAVHTLCPYHSCIGGGGFALIRKAGADDGLVETLDFRQCAPAAATAELYENSDASTSFGGAAVAVPGELKGFKMLHERYGVLPWGELFEPSIKMARDGMTMGRDLYDFLARDCPNAPSTAGSFISTDPEFAKTFTRDGELIPVGEKWSRPDYAKTLEAVARDSEAFYSGPIADSIIDAIQSRGGFMTLQDLKDYKPVWRNALSTQYRGYTVYAPPAPASGGVFLGALNALSHFGLNKPGSVEDEHIMTETLRLAYGARTELGDPAYVDCAMENSWLTGTEWSDKITEKTHEPAYYLKQEGADDNGTSNITTADGEFVVSITTTVGLIWASRIMVPGIGVVLNDSVDDFSVKGKANVWGYAPAEANFIAPNKRPLSSSCPYIVTRDGKPVLAGGAAGGSTIISANVQVFRNAIDYGQTCKQALDSARLHNQVLPNVTLLEESTNRGREVKIWSAEVVKGLEERGHKIEWIEKSRSTPCVMRISEEGYDAAGDGRKWDAGGAVFDGKVRLLG